MENYPHANNGFFVHTLSTPNFFLLILDSVCLHKYCYLFCSQAFYCCFISANFHFSTYTLANSCSCLIEIICFCQPDFGLLLVRYVTWTLLCRKNANFVVILFCCCRTFDAFFSRKRIRPVLLPRRNVGQIYLILKIMYFHSALYLGVLDLLTEQQQASHFAYPLGTQNNGNSLVTLVCFLRFRSLSLSFI